MSLAELPISYYRAFVIEEKFGFNKMTPRMFVLDLAKRGLLGILFGIPLLLGILWLMEKMGSNWWFYAWLLWMGFNLIVLAIFPVWIAPLFNKFTPLDDAPLRARIEQLMRKCGFRSQRAFCNGWLASEQPRQCVFHGFRKHQADRFF